MIDALKKTKVKKNTEKAHYVYLLKRIQTRDAVRAQALQ